MARRQSCCESMEAHYAGMATAPHELDGRDCWCGRNGYLDEILSLRSLERAYVTITTTKLEKRNSQ